MEKPAVTDIPLIESIYKRWSPRIFAETPVSNEHLRQILEAAAGRLRVLTLSRGHSLSGRKKIRKLSKSSANASCQETKIGLLKRPS